MEWSHYSLPKSAVIQEGEDPAAFAQPCGDPCDLADVETIADLANGPIANLFVGAESEQGHDMS